MEYTAEKQTIFLNTSLRNKKYSFFAVQTVSGKHSIEIYDFLNMKFKQQNDC